MGKGISVSGLAIIRNGVPHHADEIIAYRQRGLDRLQEGVVQLQAAGMPSE